MHLSALDSGTHVHAGDNTVNNKNDLSCPKLFFILGLSNVMPPLYRVAIGFHIGKVAMSQHAINAEISVHNLIQLLIAYLFLT